MRRNTIINNMNIEEYAELLKTSEWKEKRESILKRDDYTCQKCGRRGFSYRSLKISGYAELDELMKECSINGQPISNFLKSIEWKDKVYTPMIIFEQKYVKRKRWIISFKDNKSKRPFSFVVDDYPLHPSYIKYEKEDLRVWHSGKEMNFPIDFYAFKLSGYYGNTYYLKIRNDEGDISIYINGKFFCFRTSKYGLFRYIALDFVTLHVHHKYYIEDRFPWEYDDDSLITLCSDCHSETHENNKTPLFDKHGSILVSDLPICDRCNGRGELPQYKYYMNGICFKCHGAGVIIDNDEI